MRHNSIAIQPNSLLGLIPNITQLNMLSHSDHYHSNAVGSCPALETVSTGCFSLTSTPEQLTAHYRHLESLLDSALATLTLINATTTITTPPHTLHVIQVSWALVHLIGTSAHTTLTRPGSPPTSTDDLAPIATPKATYATAADPHHHQSPLATTPDPNTIKQQRPSSSPAPTRDMPFKSRVVIRFDLKPSHLPPPTQASPINLYDAIDDAISVTSPLSGVKWSQHGNLILYPRHTSTAEFLLLHKAEIWTAIHPLLKLPTKYLRPPFEVDGPWHSVVFHGVPTASTQSLDCKDITAWFDSHDVKGKVKALSILCRPEDLSTRNTVAVQVSLDSEADAEFLVKNGGCFYGLQCRVTRYNARKLRSTSPLV
ncbi:hypothetical protein C8R44DRAFT_848165 [Mycena epipterygia]|nr:hypothetical protein C8R44DRAFT_848165 [Mycena epipterygia]